MSDQLSAEHLQAPFPWFGGKSRIAEIVWSRFGDVDNYVEPFFGSGAVLLARPQIGKVETINDKDHFVANFWRAIQRDPIAVARHADWPVNETDLHARHYWLITTGRDRLAGIVGDPDAYDAQVAGWWCWGICSWIGSGWCSGDGPWQWSENTWCKKTPGKCMTRPRPHLGAGQGINRARPHLGNAGQGINRKLPHLGDAGKGINRQLPHLGNAGQGINRARPHLGDAGRGTAIQEWFEALSNRFRDVRVCAGDWSRVTGDTVTFLHGTTGLFLDPPYADTASRTADIYAQDCLRVAHDVREWAIEAGKNKLMRICLAGYDGEHVMPDDWAVVEWKARGGYGSQNRDDDGVGRVNSRRERLWFSPACIKPYRDRTLLDLMEPAA